MAIISKSRSLTYLLKVKNNTTIKDLNGFSLSLMEFLFILSKRNPQHIEYI